MRNDFDWINISVKGVFLELVTEIITVGLLRLLQIQAIHVEKHFFS